ncbi:hypothetical protein PS15m_009478 [Mucor circinelloides]
MSFFHEDGRGRIVDESGKEAAAYTDEDRRRYFYFIHEHLLKPSEAARLANVNPETARKWKRAYENDPKNKISLKKQLEHPIAFQIV